MTAFEIDGGDVVVEVLDLGGVLRSVRHAGSANLTLAVDDPVFYRRNPPYFGAIIGRYANRIAGGRFGLDGRAYEVAANDGANHLHGGPGGFHSRVWHAGPAGDAAVRLTLASDDGDGGYPSRLEVAVTYAVEGDSLRIEYEATNAGDRPTVLNLTNHAYWNLAGGGDVLGHGLTVHADGYLPTDAGQIPTGEVAPVAGTAFDYRDGPAVRPGVDHCFVVRGEPGTLRPAARLAEPRSGRWMEVMTTEPGVQVYAGNNLDGSADAGGFPRHGGACLETQHYPDSPNRPAFPSTRLDAGATYRSTTVHRFGIG